MPVTARLRSLAAFAAAAFQSATVVAASYSLGPTADAMVSSAYPDSNYGGAGAFTISAAGLPNGAFQSVLQFDLSGAKASFDATYGDGQWALAAASLNMTAADPKNGLFNSSAPGLLEASWMQTDSWTEGTGKPNSPSASGITWNALAALLSSGDRPLGSLNFDGATSGSVAFSLAPSNGFATDLAAGGILSLRLFAPAGEADVSALFNSRSFGTDTSRPVLLLEAVAVPEPATVGLALAGLLVFLAQARRTRRWHMEEHDG